MTTLIPSTVVRPISPMLASGPSCADVTFLFRIDPEAGIGTGWGTVEWSALPKVDIATLYMLNCVATSSMTMVTGKQFVKSIAAAVLPDESHAGIAISDLRAVVGAISEARPLHLAADLDALLTLAVQAQGPPPNIEEWARQLAADIGELAD